MNFITILNVAKKYVLFIVLGVFTMVLAINYFVNSSEINKTGVYVIGEIIAKKDYKAGSSSYEYKYCFNQEEFVGKAVGVGLGNAQNLFYYLKPNDPKIIKFWNLLKCHIA